MTDEIMDLMIEQTNNYAIELQRLKRVVRSARISRWHNTDREEMEAFLGKYKNYNNFLFFFSPIFFCLF